jgi:heat shock protein HslJ
MERGAAPCRPVRMRIFGSLILLLIITACGTGTTDALDGRTFISTSVVDGGEDRPLVANTEIRLTFTDGQLGASAGCNTFGGSFRVEDATLIVEGGAMTEMGCDEERSAQDEWLFALLGGRPQLALSDNELSITAGETLITLLDREIAEPDLALVGPTWTVDTLITGDAASSVPDGATATITFADDGTVDIETGCNTGGGRYSVSGDEIQFAEIVQTEIGCDGAAAALEEAVVALLASGTVAYSVEADRLTLMAGDHGLGLRGS